MGMLARRPGNSRKGSQLVEAALILLPFCAMVFLLMDVAWSTFVKATLQAAVREGARYGMTGNTAGGTGQVGSVKAIVRNHAMGLLDGNQADRIRVEFYAADTQMPTGSNQGGNLIIVSVENYAFVPLAPFLHSGNTVLLTVRSGDRLERLPGGALPPL